MVKLLPPPKKDQNYLLVLFVDLLSDQTDGMIDFFHFGKPACNSEVNQVTKVFNEDNFQWVKTGRQPNAIFFFNKKKLR